MVSLFSSGRMRRRQGFTITELLVAMALIVFIMNILSQAFVAGLESFRQLKGIGDLQEDLRMAAIDLRSDTMTAGRQASLFIASGLRTGSVDPMAAANLRKVYAAICDDAVALDARLRIVERQTTNPVARRVMQRTLDALARLKLNASRMVELLGLFGPPTPPTD